MAEATGLAPRTVKSAISSLKQLGFVERIGGRTGQIRVTLPLVEPKTGFTRRQTVAINRLLDRASKLIGGDAWRLVCTSFELLGVPQWSTVKEAYEALQTASTPSQRRQFVQIVIELVNSKEVRGRELRE
jgi:hypothetical protein